MLPPRYGKISHIIQRVIYRVQHALLMKCLHYTFFLELKNMEGLYNEVIKARYKNINNKFSPDISEILKILFKVKLEDRPSCQEVLNHALDKKRLEFFQAEARQEVGEVNEAIL